jgi:hypothetical protein
MEATERDDRHEAAGPVEADDDHLADVPDGCGCAEVWEHLSGRRA